MVFAEIELWKAIVLGAVQGVTELLPVSSSAHLVLVPWFFGWSDPGLTFDVALHLGTLVAILGYFWHDLWGMFTALLRGLAKRRPLAEPNSRLALYVIVSSIPGAVFGALLDSRIEALFHVENASGGPLLIIAAALIVMGLLMAVAERVAVHRRALTDLGWRDAIVVGLAQAFALIPGVSRSGTTITTGLFLGMRRETAARFSFLLAAPITGGAALKKIYELIQGGGLAQDERLPFLVGVITAGLVGYACIAWLLRYLQRSSTMIFTVYRVLLGVIVIVLVLVRG